MPRIDFTRLPDEVLLRHEFLRPVPVQMGRTLWGERAANGHAPAPVIWNGRLTARKWADIRRFLAGAVADQARSNGRPWSSSMPTKRTTAKVPEVDKMVDIPGTIFPAHKRQLAVL